MMKMILVVLSVCIVGMTAFGCTQANQRDVSYFAEYGKDGKATYYRTTLTWYSKNGVVDYRSGWYDKRAVDELFGDIAGKDDLEASRKSRAKEAVRSTFSSYMDALESNGSAEIVSSRKKQYEEALTQARGVTQVVSLEGLRGRPDPLSKKHNQKFIIILSHDPDAIIKKIRERVKSNNNKDMINEILEHQLTKESAPLLTRLHLLHSESELLHDRLSSLSKGQNLDKNKIDSIVAEMDK